MDTYTFVAEADLPEMGIHLGDVVLVRPGHQRSVVVCHSVTPNYGAVLGAHEAGALRYVTPRPLADLQMAVGAPHPSRPPLPPAARRRPPHLSVLR